MKKIFTILLIVSLTVVFAVSLIHSIHVMVTCDGDIAQGTYKLICLDDK